MLIGTRSATLDFQMAEPKFSSLVLALKEPLINFTNLERRLKKLERATKEPLQASAIAAEIGANSAHFVQQMDEIALPQPKAK